MMAQAAESTDYIVVGAGSAGCAIARRLADTGARVTLVEAGGHDRSRLFRVPGLNPFVHMIPGLRKRYDWNYVTVPQQATLQRTMPLTSGRVLGGSSSVNGMLFVRGNPQNYDDWAAGGCPGWSFPEVLASFRRMETWEDGESDLRGGSGPVRITRNARSTPATQGFMAALSEQAGVPHLDDYNGRDQEGVGLVQQTVHGGRRSSASAAYLEDAPAGMLTVRTAALVDRVVIEKGRAVGVELVEGGRTVRITADREVILSSGTFGSPQLLMRSGVGPAAHLRELGIAVTADLPVGENLQDHVFVPLVFRTTAAIHRSNGSYMLRAMAADLLRRDTHLRHSAFDGIAFVRSSLAGRLPDLQMHMLPFNYPAPNRDGPKMPKVDSTAALTVFPTLLYPQSRGRLRLASARAGTPPLIDPAYLTEARDREVLLDGIEMVREVMASGKVAPDVTELHPGPATASRSALAEDLKVRAATVYHAVGTCRMGSDERAVVDPQLRVRGIEGLRVADASIAPAIPGGNTNAMAMMIGEHAAAMIVGNRP